MNIAILKAFSSELEKLGYIPPVESVSPITSSKENIHGGYVDQKKSNQQQSIRQQQQKLNKSTKGGNKSISEFGAY